MKAEHLTILGSSVTRDTAEIMLHTIAHFKHLEVHPKLATIDKTPFSVKTTVADGLAIFNIMKGTDIVTVTVCCFDGNDTESAMLYVRDLVRGNPLYKNAVIRQPTEPLWFFSIPVNIFALPQDMILAAEIEFYIWNAIRLGLKNKIKQ